MTREKMNAFEAISQAQMLSFYPIVFQAVIAAKRLGILEFLNKNKGYNKIEDISKGTSISKYGIKVLLDMLCKVQVSERNEDDQFALGSVGFFVLHDKQTSINLDFVQNVCYKGAYHLTESIKQEKPIGLKEIGNWDTLYEGLLELPSQVAKSWFDFDHFYSDAIFNNALDIIFSSSPNKIMDIGGNTGKFTLEVCKYNIDVNVTIVDLNKQLIAAEKNIKTHGFIDRVSFVEQNMLSENINLPKDIDVIWMSQFLDCFSEKEIEYILNQLTEVANKDIRILIVELFWDNQQFEAAEYCLLGTSLYFTFIANGNSRMYSEKDFKKIISKTKLKIVNQQAIGKYHTLLELRVKE